MLAALFTTRMLANNTTRCLAFGVVGGHASPSGHCGLSNLLYWLSRNATQSLDTYQSVLPAFEWPVLRGPPADITVESPNLGNNGEADSIDYDGLQISSFSADHWEHRKNCYNRRLSNLDMGAARNAVRIGNGLPGADVKVSGPRRFLRAFLG